MKQALPWIFLSILLGACGQVLLKVVARSLGTSGASFISSLPRMVLLPQLWVGVLLFVVSMVLWVRALTTAPLGMAYPMVSAGYVIVALLSWLLFGEIIVWRQVLGMAAIALGVVLLASPR